MIHATLIITLDAFDSDKADQTVNIREWLIKQFPQAKVIEADADKVILQLAPMAFDSATMSYED